MKSKQTRPKVTIAYETPTAGNLGPAAAIVGASCVTGIHYSPGGLCSPVGNAAGTNCDWNGNSAGGACE